MFVWAVDRAESIDPDGVIHNPKGRKLEIICKVPKMLWGDGLWLSTSAEILTLGHLFLCVWPGMSDFLMMVSGNYLPVHLYRIVLDVDGVLPASSHLAERDSYCNWNFLHILIFHPKHFPLSEARNLSMLSWLRLGSCPVVRSDGEGQTWDELLSHTANGKCLTDDLSRIFKHYYSRGWQ